jgi:hypothetical protein
MGRAVALLQVLEVLKSEETVVDVPVPDGEHVNVCGDVHGQASSTVW